jgi:tripartite motif-containing protein 71
LKFITLKFLTIYLFLFSLETSAQTYVLDYSLGKFFSASAFAITSSGFIYLADDGSNSLLKLDTLGNIIKEIGGYGWSESTFDVPSDVYADPLKVFVCDKQNHRVKNFDKDLNFIYEFYTRESDISEERFGYPLSCGVSSMGDLYILDSENIRILKFDLFGNFIQNFGGFDAGIFALKNPKKLAVNSNNSILVLDDSVLVIFDHFGNGKDKINLGNSFTSLKISFNYLTLNNENNIYISSFENGNYALNKINLIAPNVQIKIVSCTIFNNKLYVLTPKEVLVFNRAKE